jgi:hypothetical protein
MEKLRTGMKPSNWVAWTILPRRSWSLAIRDLHDLHEARPDFAYSAFHAIGGAAIPTASGAAPAHSPTVPRQPLPSRRQHNEPQRNEGADSSGQTGVETAGFTIGRKTRRDRFHWFDRVDFRQEM